MMPPELKCPCCGDLVPDWHFEWHLRGDQREIFACDKAMECPSCRGGVAFDGFLLTVAGPQRPLVRRSLQQAARWARNQSNNLHDYRQTNEGKRFAGHWSDADVNAADAEAARQP
jgi:hypothetical protein